MNANANLNLAAIEEAERKRADLKQAMGCFATGVTIAATHHDGADHGMTCNSFNTVSLQPAMVLWSIRRESASRAAFLESGGYTISVLSSGQQALAKRFTTGAPHHRFEGIGAERLSSGRLRVSGAIAWFDCELVEAVSAGDHDVLIGRVIDFAAEPSNPLLYIHGAFVTDD